MTNRKERPIDVVREIHEDDTLPEALQESVDWLVKRFPKMRKAWRDAAHAMVKALGRDQFEDKD